MNDPAGRFVQLLCHDMNNPLTILYGQAALLTAALAAPELDESRLRAIIAQVEDQTERLISLVAEMRSAFHHVEGEDAHETMIEPVVREAAAFVARLWRYRAGTFELDLPDEDVYLHMRPIATRAIVWRMFAAAVDRSPRVRVRLEHADALWRLIVAESGGVAGAGTAPLDAGLKLGLVGSGWHAEPWLAGAETGWVLVNSGADRTTPG